ncbi:MAG: oxidoreductase [Rhizobiales bacterium 32-66-11]|jgi:uncharacterized oxidoreductase|nr:MAG: oxidoreductase [Rhizobiales bacterium 32-66-11]
MKLEEKTVLLTGAGSGIGRAAALAFARKGARLLLAGRRAAPLEETAALVRAAGGSAQVQVCDVTVAADRAALIAAASAAFGGRLDILVNNAGNVRAGRLEQIPEAEIEAMIGLNLLAPILLSRAALPLLRASGDAAIVNVSSGFGLVGGPFYGTYAAAKAGLGRFGEALRRELLGEGVHVMTLYPTATDTPMLATNKAGPDLGFVRETPEAVADGLIEGLESNAREVIRGGAARLAMMTKNREEPEAVDERFRTIKADLEAAVSTHRAF